MLSVLSFVTVLLTSSLGVLGTGNKCFKNGDLLDAVGYGEINHPPFWYMASLGPIDCARKCKLHSLCFYVNFDTETLNCSLISNHSLEFVPNSNILMINVNSWDDNILSTCKNHLCPNNTVCKEKNNGYDCELIGCTGIPQVPNINVTSFTKKALWEFGEVVEYACNRGYYTKSNFTCLVNGSWSKVNCRQYVKCADTKICSEGQTKEYWLYISIFNSLQKCFCRYVAAFSFYISLPEYNTASYPIYSRNGTSCALKEITSPQTHGMGNTDFQKLRVFLQTGEIKFNNTRYSNSSISTQPYGRAGDCYAGNDSSVCGVLGYFLINTRRTGLKIKSTTKWKTWGTDGVIHNITRSEDGHVIEGYCGGNCGGCEPEVPLYLEADPTFPPENDTAELPICKFPIV